MEKLFGVLTSGLFVINYTEISGNDKHLYVMILFGY